ncbi:MAG: hypothetical protein A2821_03890 [Candidatus Magasanikbacteria bacterium RIFCSPHIGHO2_01_FULL_41_23]|uniref:ATP synthase subunit delta n=1 Tax=Candidatus Magasanikbacteria bacterium RIFCSPLOWO2_01_FULL_40_15 TaxID=1798686 RepID=A0A1F6N3G0_9BACT|nr:MAG: hypothetical protein A2821_03890 [Candidatus Magasanikbacteria bacterium RIFCSPHIGHO2_01_FULL_41_23]OGH66957.1 MAG: hypothetical protein A3C66_00430 [Candidatus Magasanikbacteria bacterium RIFCSPHIGHO2_02_FULL_41_35]OGH74938.1 MAG: hypothetical protein A3F22_02565 [Candidatus Magasanikbacteria bacterium RIFCSPHIGHO2_12_FULL_41_16]OGH78240.1 MAG: hypothetical protein A2983_02200 [Candidatus Magasanikbacteria bacterium RIFCSPLOWO2_01_FULL_40_15]
MPKLLPRQYAKILYAVTHEAKDVPKAVGMFAKFLERRRATKKLPVIIAEFLNLVQEKQGILNVKVTTARVLPENKIIELVKKVLVPSGLSRVPREVEGEVAVEINVDATIVGGMIMETSTHRWDASVKNQLVQLNNQLTRK